MRLFRHFFNNNHYRSFALMLTLTPVPNACCQLLRDHLREFPLEMIFNIVYHTPDTVVKTPEEDQAGSNGDGLSIEVQMAWGGSSTYNFQVQEGIFCLVDIRYQ